MVPSHYPDLLAIPLEKFQKLKDPRLQPNRAYRLSRKVWGAERTLLVTFSPELQRKQMRGIQQHVAKKQRALHELQPRTAHATRR